MSGKMAVLRRFLRGLVPRNWPDDPVERRRMKMFTLGAASMGQAGQKIEVEDAKSGHDDVSAGSVK